MKTILVLSVDPTQAKTVAEDLSSWLNYRVDSLQDLKQQETTKSPTEWEYWDHYDLGQKAIKKWGSEPRVVYSSVALHPLKAEDPIVPLIPYPPKPADVINRYLQR